jgi:hypothetical protein
MSLMMGGVDKVILGTAATFGLRQELNLVGQQYSWASSLSMFPSKLEIHTDDRSLLRVNVDCLSADLALSAVTYRQGNLLSPRCQRSRIDSQIFSVNVFFFGVMTFATIGANNVSDQLQSASLLILLGPWALGLQVHSGNV